jgi:hypothetical protein
MIGRKNITLPPSGILSPRFGDFIRVLFAARPSFLVLAAWAPMGDKTKSDSGKAS